MDKVLKGHEELSFHGTATSVDCGYGFLKIPKPFLAQSTDGVIIMPEHILSCHLSVAKLRYELHEKKDDGISYHSLRIDDWA